MTGSGRCRAWLLAAALVCASCGGPEPVPVPDGREPRHLILVTVDTWRADHFLTDQAGVFLTPRLAELAERSVRFASASSPAALTSAGIAGILTGLMPKRSGVIANEHTLSELLPNLPTVLSDAGFHTGAFVANPVLGPGFGFENGFERFERVRRIPPRIKAKADAVVRRALDWLDQAAPGEQAARERIFLWTHFMEPHGPYEPPEGVRELFRLEAFDAPTEIALQPLDRQSGWQGIPGYQQAALSPVPTDGRDYLLRYAAEIRYLDEQLGLLVAELEKRKILDRAVLVLTADHGEALAGDHGFYFSHDNGLTQDQVHVPLLLYYPGCPAGEIVERPVSTIDVLPTVLGRLGIPPPAEVDGFDLLAERPEVVVAESIREQSVREGSWKLRWIKHKRQASLVDLDADPLESDDLSAAFPERRAELERRLREIRRRPALAKPVARADPRAEQRENLKALGYLGGSEPAEPDR